MSHGYLPLWILDKPKDSAALVLAVSGAVFSAVPADLLSSVCSTAVGNSAIVFGIRFLFRGKFP